MKRPERRGNAQRIILCKQQVLEEENRDDALRRSNSLRHTARGRRHEVEKYCMDPYFGFCKCSQSTSSTSRVCKKCALTTE